jgi:NADH-quinone oxidoreductase subunit N
MQLDLPNVELAAIAPEVVLSLTALLLIVFDALVGDRIKNGLHLPVLTSLGLIVAFGFAFTQWNDLDQTGPLMQLAGMVVLDGFALFVKLSLLVFGFLSLWLSREYLVREKLEEPEYYALTLFAVAGMMLMATAADLIVMFIALETFSLSLYVMVGFRRRSLISQEAAMKYFLLGAFSSAFFLLGIALAYGAVGSTNLYGVAGSGTELGMAQFLATTTPQGTGLLVLGAGLLIIGLGFKVAAVPFHMWTPDAYQGAPAPVTGFMAAGSKLAGFAALLRLLDVSLFQLRGDWQPIVIGIAVLTMFVGAVMAVVQEDVKRILAYSSIAHAGFVFTGILAASDRGVSGSLFYLATYGVTVLGAFALVAMLGGSEERAVRLTDYKGLFYRRPMLAGALSLLLLSLAGVPLTSGFIGKLVVFEPAIEAGFAWVVVVGMIASAIAAFFYLRIMVVMYMQKPDEGVAAITLRPVAGAVLALSVVATLALGVLPTPLLDLVEKATLFFAT